MMISPDDIRKFIEQKRMSIQRERDSYGLSPRGIINNAINPDTNQNGLNFSLTDDNRISQNASNSSSALLTTDNSLNIEKLKSTSGLSLGHCSLRSPTRTTPKEYALEKSKVPPLDLRNDSDRRDQQSDKSTNLTSGHISRILRKQAGLPTNMLKTGEFSPNNPIVRPVDSNQQDQRKGDIFLGLGEYEERRKKLMKLRQLEYKEYLDRQNQLRKHTSMREMLQRNTDSKMNVQHNPESESKRLERNAHASVSIGNHSNSVNTRTISVGVQTDLEEMESYKNAHYTRAEKELSPRPVEPISDWNMNVDRVKTGMQNNVFVPHNGDNVQGYRDVSTDVKEVARKDSPRERLLQDLRHTYMPSLFDVDAIKIRNLQAEEEAAARKLTYQEDLKKQIADQQRIREERKAKEKMLEEAEARRLEQQLQYLKLAQEKEIDKQKDLGIRVNRNTNAYNIQRRKLQTEIDREKRNLMHAKVNAVNKLQASGSRMNVPDASQSNKAPFDNAPVKKKTDNEMRNYDLRESNAFDSLNRPTYTTNMPGNSKFAQNPKRIVPSKSETSLLKAQQKLGNTAKVTVANRVQTNGRSNYEPNFLKKDIADYITRDHSKQNFDFNDPLPIPVLKYKENEPRFCSATVRNDEGLSDNMKTVINKWQVPAVQKNILKNGLSGDGKSNSILTQLGSIRKQLQLEQMRLDQTIVNNRRTNISSIR